MSYIPDCRTDEYYNEKYLIGDDFEFLNGFDFAVEQAVNLLSNVDVYPELEELLADNKAIVKEGKTKIVEESLQHWFEMQRNELITSMIDSMDEDEYKKVKAKVDEGQRA